ncbi:hypothetical protein D9758_006343 [Tetrapyrgos nigripes]|uniref:F-box domain-containing protein n=1 Tax=Tetrapyrgos nigripes TaxID=182062 RepID=A0A8H5D8L5_9AGAR|nr:hypothetical protein D9758_006343 [Tetrapyrgos nigripes]
MIEQAHFTSLPLDLLLVIFDWMSPLDIIHLRQCLGFCPQKHFSLFLPPGPHTLHPVSELERILVRAQRLDEDWCLESGAPQLKTIRELTYEQDIRCMHLYYGRYLINLKLEALIGINRYFNVTWNPKWHFNTIFGAMIRGEAFKAQRLGCILQSCRERQGICDPMELFYGRLMQVLTLPVEPYPITPVVISNGYLQQSWSPDDFIVLRDQVIAMHLHPRTKFECFAIYKQDETRTDDIRLQRTHCGEWDVSIRRPQALVYRPPTSSTDEANFIFVSVMPLQETVKLCLLEVILRQDGTISFNKIAEGNDTSYFLSADICHRERFIRALVRCPTFAKSAAV